MSVTAYRRGLSEADLRAYFGADKVSIYPDTLNRCTRYYIAAGFSAVTFAISDEMMSMGDSAMLFMVLDRARRNLGVALLSEAGVANLRRAAGRSRESREEEEELWEP